MTPVAFRSFLTWNLMLAATAVVAFWTYYHGLDPQNASTMTSASAATANAGMHSWLDGFRQSAMHYWTAGTAWRGQVYNGLTQPR